MSDRPSMPTRSEPADALAALARAKLARLVAECFVEPSPAALQRLKQSAVRAEALEAAAALNLPTKPIRSALDAFRSIADWIDWHNRLFGHTVRAACPPYEIEYLHAEVFQQSQTLADIAGFYAAFGFTVGGPFAERPDHFVTQWEFLSALAMKESIAGEAGNVEGRACCREAQAAFLAEHAARWMPAFFERIRRTAPNGQMTGPFTAIVDFADSLLQRWCDEFDVRLGPRWIELRPVTDDDEQITCGGGTASVELGPTMAAAMAERD